MYKLQIKVNGEDIWLTDFPSKIITNAVLGMVQSLQDVDQIQDVKVEIIKEE